MEIDSSKTNQLSENLQGSGEYVDGGGVGGVFSLLILGSIIDGSTSRKIEDFRADFLRYSYLEMGHDYNDKD